MECYPIDRDIDICCLPDDTCCVFDDCRNCEGNRPGSDDWNPEECTEIEGSTGRGGPGATGGRGGPGGRGSAYGSGGMRY